ncbi:MAG: hypothetical protein LQ352_006826, partial [Teloschistes flavicans]
GLQLSATARANPRVAITEGCYGAGFGPLHYNAVYNARSGAANGACPVVIRTHDPSGIAVQVARAKGMECVAVMAEMVSARDGRVMRPEVWEELVKACDAYDLMLVVDEALTAIRCGAPFAYQLPQYCKHGYPDLVLFGKAVRTNGVAIEWRGVNVGKLGIVKEEQRQYTILDWQERLTAMASAADLLISWGTILLAEKEDWPLRARKVGQILRAFLEEDGVASADVGGLHSLIYVGEKDAARFSWPVMGAKAGKHVRWLPVLDEVMMSEEKLREKVFGGSSVAHRKEISAWLRSQGLKLGYCSRCGQCVEADVQACELCVVRVCEECEPGKHVCPMEDE